VLSVILGSAARNGTLMNTLKRVFGNISGGRVLDVATGNGNFVQSLIENLKDYVELVGIDNNERVVNAMREKSKRENIRFARMDAERLDFADATFDTVCISNSLHHMKNLPQVLSEMKRVLKPDGHFIVGEMFRDNQTDAQLTHVYLHHWWAATDTALGIFHNETFMRQYIVDFVTALSLRNLIWYDYADLGVDPLSAEINKELDGIIDRYIERAKGMPNEIALCQQGEDLRARVHAIGFHSATTLIAIGEKA
jgi:ubiquinone/menaquinone biosynthesis C-methylase UbiE